MTETRSKRCTKCGQVKDVDAFARVRADRQWLRPKCRECDNVRIFNHRKAADQ